MELEKPEKNIEELPPVFNAGNPDHLPWIPMPIIPVQNTPSTNVYNSTAQQLTNLCSDNEWDVFYNENLSKVDTFTAENITPHLRGEDTLFYPFGGPDIIYAFKFFPHVANYVLVGLEPIGDFDVITQNLSNNQVTAALKTAFSFYLERGYFITSQMSRQLSNKSIRGVLYLILVELKKCEYFIKSVENISINFNGEETVRQKEMLDGVKITATSPQGVIKTIYFIRTDLGNANRNLQNLFNFVGKRPFATFIKSASYALHDKNLSYVRDFIIDRSNAILQDDSGCPFFRFVAFPDKYKLYVFGEYTKPTLSVFAAYEQKTLSDYYLKHSARPIPFKIGYDQRKANLQLFIRRGIFPQFSERTLLSPLQHASRRSLTALEQKLPPIGQSHECPCKKGKGNSL
jgi:hypothetical protein